MAVVFGPCNADIFKSLSDVFLCFSTIAFEKGRFGEDGGVPSGTFSSEKTPDARLGLEGASSGSMRRCFLGASWLVVDTSSDRFAYVRLIMFAKRASIMI